MIINGRLSIWDDEQYRALQGTYPVLFLSFARIKETNYENSKAKVCFISDEDEDQIYELTLTNQEVSVQVRAGAVLSWFCF